MTWNNTGVTGPGNAYTYTYTGNRLNIGLYQAAETASSSASQNINNAPDGISTLQPLKNLDLAGYATNINQTVSALPTTIHNLIMTGTDCNTYFCFFKKILSLFLMLYYQI